jgi:hypothetical protein
VRTIRLMTDTYASTDQLADRLSPGYTMPSDDDALKLLTKASELVDYATLGRAQRAFSDTTTPAEVIEALSTAVCDQVEFWLEVGEEHDVLGLPKNSSLQGGRVQVQRMPGYLGRRAQRTLSQSGLLWAGARSV